MKHKIIIACMIGLMTATAAFAADEPTNEPPAAPHSPRPMFGILPPHILDQLALTPEQKAKYDPLNAEFKSEVAKSRAENTGAGTNAAPGGGRQAMRELHKSYVEKVKGFLTAEQTATLDKAMQHGPGGHGGPNGGPNGSPPPQAPPPGNN
jgi:Spy/CpxP family protein refolding chaperone